jgi:hypothetical protein
VWTIGSKLRLCLLLLGLGGCAIGNQHQYAGVAPDLTLKATHTVSVLVVDSRPYVVNGAKDPDFVGLQRGGFGNPFDVTTASRKALASDIADDIVAALQKRNIQSAAVAVKPGTPAKEALKAAAGAGKDRGLVVDLREWKSDTYTNTALTFDVQATVCDASGDPLATVARQGDEDLGGSLMNPPGHAKDAVPPAFKKTMESLLNAPEIIAALQ